MVCSIILRQSGIERRQTERSVFEYLDKLASRAKEKDRTELRVQAAANDQLVAIELDHGLDAHPLEMLTTTVARDTGGDRLISLAHGVLAGHVELHAAHVGLVRDCLGVELEDDREADRNRRRDGVVLGHGNARFHGRNAIGGQDLFRLVLSE